MTDMDIAPTRLAVHQLCKLVASGRITAQQFTDMTKDLLGGLEQHPPHTHFFLRRTCWAHEDAPIAIVLGGAAAAHAPDAAEASIGIYGLWGGQPAHYALTKYWNILRFVLAQ
jgi:hypothetical protein